MRTSNTSLSKSLAPYFKKTSSRVDLPLNRAERGAKPKEVAGQVQDKDASAPEMMYAKGLNRANLSFIFQFPVETAQSLPGKDRMVDFLVDEKYADEIDGEIAHKTLSQKTDDELRDLQVNEALRQFGIQPIRRNDARDFKSAEHVDRIIRQNYL